jgi:acetyl esterase/lipase
VKPRGTPLLLLILVTAPLSAQTLMTGKDLLALPQPPADRTFAYGPAPQQVAELRLPEGPGPHPVVVLVHGGCWEAPWGFDHVRSLAAALAAEGWATWSLEYRRLGDPGGGWPGTFLDVARGADHLREASSSAPLDLERVAALGHSAGGHLALWLAARHRLPADSPLRGDRPLALRGVVSLAGIPDLRSGIESGVCGDAIPRLLGDPKERDARLREASPVELLPLGVAQRLVYADRDAIVPLDLGRAHEASARRAGDPVVLEVVEGAGHFELVNPSSRAFPAVRRAIAALLPLPFPGGRR